MCRRLPLLLIAPSLLFMVQARPAAAEPIPGVVTVTITGPRPAPAASAQPDGRDTAAVAAGVGSPIAAGYLHTCAVTKFGGAKCWGSNGYGEAGNGSNYTKILLPVVVSGLARGVAAIAAGGYHTCAVTETGGVKCWGANYDGQLGDGTPTTERHTPVDVSGLTRGVAAIAAGYFHTCAVTEVGGAKCWGANGHGQLGDRTTTERRTPVDVTGLTDGVAAVAAGSWHTCALTEAGGVKCWGANGHGQLGDGTTTAERRTPVDVSGLTSGVVAIAAGHSHTCALTDAGGVKCWGQNMDAQLGDGTRMESRTPVDVSGLSSGIVAIAAGYFHTCAVTDAGGAKCWGKNRDGQLGNGGTLNQSRPGNVRRLTTGVAAIAGGAHHTCAVTETRAMCTGDNKRGELGDGSLTDRLIPVRVRRLRVP